MFNHLKPHFVPCKFFVNGRHKHLKAITRKVIFDGNYFDVLVLLLASCLLILSLGFNCAASVYFYAFNELEKLVTIEVPIPAGFALAPGDALNNEPFPAGASFVSNVEAWLAFNDKKMPNEGLIIVHVSGATIFEGSGKMETIERRLEPKKTKYICDIPDAYMGVSLPFKDVDMIDFLGMVRVKDMDVEIAGRWFFKDKDEMIGGQYESQLCTWTKIFIETNQENKNSTHLTN